MQMIFPDGADRHALGAKAKDILPPPISELIKRTLNTRSPVDLVGITHKDASLTFRCVPFEGEQIETKGTILIAF